MDTLINNDNVSAKYNVDPLISEQPKNHVSPYDMIRYSSDQTSKKSDKYKYISGLTFEFSMGDTVYNSYLRMMNTLKTNKVESDAILITTVPENGFYLAKLFISGKEINNKCFNTLEIKYNGNVIYQNIFEPLTTNDQSSYNIDIRIPADNLKRYGFKI